MVGSSRAVGGTEPALACSAVSFQLIFRATPFASVSASFSRIREVIACWFCHQCLSIFGDNHRFFSSFQTFIGILANFLLLHSYFFSVFVNLVRSSNPSLAVQKKAERVRNRRDLVWTNPRLPQFSAELARNRERLEVAVLRGQPFSLYDDCQRRVVIQPVMPLLLKDQV